MNTRKYIEGICFEWDSIKAHLVWQKHNVSFDEALTVLVYDDFSYTNEDTRDYNGEQRYITIGLSTKIRLLCVTWTVRNDCYRIITARQANKYERRGYEHGKTI